MDPRCLRRCFGVILVSIFFSLKAINIWLLPTAVHKSRWTGIQFKTQLAVNMSPTVWGFNFWISYHVLTGYGIQYYINYKVLTIKLHQGEAKGVFPLRISSLFSFFLTLLSELILKLSHHRLWCSPAPPAPVCIVHLIKSLSSVEHFTYFL